MKEEKETKNLETCYVPLRSLFGCVKPLPCETRRNSVPWPRAYFVAPPDPSGLYLQRRTNSVGCWCLIASGTVVFHVSSDSSSGGRSP